MSAMNLFLSEDVHDQPGSCLDRLPSQLHSRSSLTPSRFELVLVGCHLGHRRGQAGTIRGLLPAVIEHLLDVLGHGICVCLFKDGISLDLVPKVFAHPTLASWPMMAMSMCSQMSCS